MQRLLRLLADPTRVRILAVLEGEDLAVNEIAEVLGTSQSRTSNHLRLLREGGALAARREGSWTFYSNALTNGTEGAALWTAVRQGLRRDRTWRADRRRRHDVLERRRRLSRTHFDGQGAGTTVSFDGGSVREEILAALAPEDWTVVDAGCGDGFLTEVLAERFARVLAVDHSPTRLRAARQRISNSNVEFHEGEIDALPIEDRCADAVFLSLVLHHVPEISAGLEEAYRVLRPSGRLVVADLGPHQEESMRSTMGDLRLGLEPETLLRALEAAGFAQCRELPVRDRMVVGRAAPLALFLAVGRRPQRGRNSKSNPASKSRRSR